MRPVWVSKELLGIRGDVIVERDVAEACNRDDDHQKRKSKQQRKILVKFQQNLQFGGWAGGAGRHAGRFGGEPGPSVCPPNCVREEHLKI